MSEEIFLFNCYDCNGQESILNLNLRTLHSWFLNWLLNASRSSMPVTKRESAALHVSSTPGHNAHSSHENLGL